MAINQETIAINICRATVGYVTALLTALENLEGIKEQMAGAAISLAEFEAAIAANTEIMHCDAATYTAIINLFIPFIKTSLAADYDGAPTMQGLAALEKARSR
jgi:hypothetical protein